MPTHAIAVKIIRIEAQYGQEDEVQNSRVMSRRIWRDLWIDIIKSLDIFFEMYFEHASTRNGQLKHLNGDSEGGKSPTAQKFEQYISLSIFLEEEIIQSNKDGFQFLDG